MSSRFRPFDSLSDPNIHRRKLPHWEAAGATYFVTFRLADSIPASARRELENTERAWLCAHGLRDRSEITRLSSQAQQQYRSVLSRAEHQHLDSGHGACHLREASLRNPLIEAMHFKDGQVYCLDRYVIMPNHVHALILPAEGERLSSIVGNWKKFSAKTINQSLRRTGPLWQDEAFDHIVRAADRLRAFRHYINDNPVKANLSQGAYHLGTGSGIVI